MRCNKIRLISFLGFLVILLVSFNVFLLSKLNSVSGEGYLIRFKVSQLGWSLMVFFLERKSRSDDEKFGSLRDMYVRPFLLVPFWTQLLNSGSNFLKQYHWSYSGEDYRTATYVLCAQHVDERYTNGIIKDYLLRTTTTTTTSLKNPVSCLSTDSFKLTCWLTVGQKTADGWWYVTKLMVTILSHYCWAWNYAYYRRQCD